MNLSSAPAESEKMRIIMKKKYGVCFGILAMGLAIAGAPLARAQNRMAANGPSGATETNATTASAPAASSPVDLDRRVEELEKELVELRSEMAARKQTEEATAATPAPAPAAIPQDKAPDKGPEKVTVASLLGPTSVSGFVDGYYQVNFNHPFGGNGTASGGPGFRAFDFRDKTISLNMVELILDKAPDASGPAGRTGYHVALGYGDGINVVNSFDPAGINFARNLKEAYLSYLAPVGKGLQIDFGKFVTPMGAEVIESKDNWNYSRGMLFTWAIPFYHFGLRAKYTFNDKAALTGYLVNGWNNVVDNNSGKTFGFSLALTPTKKLSIIPTYLTGPEAPTGAYGLTTTGSPVSVNSTKAWRHTVDVVVGYNATSKLSFLANADYGRGDKTSYDLATNTFSPSVWWTGFAGYVKYAPDDKDYVAARYEYYEDHDDFMTASVFPRVHFNTITATYQRTISTHLLTRLEYRRDMSQFPVYQLSTFSQGIKHQDTVGIGLILLFDSRDAK
jgi:Putative beta-barrel porin-2, OmpL-like. bbp2